MNVPRQGLGALASAQRLRQMITLACANDTKSDRGHGNHERLPGAEPSHTQRQFQRGEPLMAGAVIFDAEQARCAAELDLIVGRRTSRAEALDLVRNELRCIGCGEFPFRQPSRCNGDCRPGF